MDEELFVQNNIVVEGGAYISGGVNIEGGVGLNGFTFPRTDGVAGQSLVTDGSGLLSFALNGVTHVTKSDNNAVISVTDEDFLIRLTSSANQAVNLPSATDSPGRRLVFYKKVSGGIATIVAQPGNTIDGVGSFLELTTQFDRCVMVSDGEDTWISI